MKNLKPIRLVLNKPLTGPYGRLLRRPGPEVMAMAAGETTVIIRGTRLVEALPIWEAETACYYQKGKGRQGWSAGDFSTIQAARNWQPKETVDLLAVPMGYFKLPNAKWVSQLATELTPWRCEVVENWRLGVEQAIWMTVLRLYRFQPIEPEFIKDTGLNIRVKPFQANKLRPITSDGDYIRQIDAIQEVVEPDSAGAILELR